MTSSHASSWRHAFTLWWLTLTQQRWQTDQTDAENPSLSDDETTEILKVHKRARLGSDPLSNIKSESRIDDEMPESEMKEEDIKLICDDIQSK